MRELNFILPTLKQFILGESQITPTPAALPSRSPVAAALDSGELPALESERLWLRCIASATAVNAVYVALENSRAAAPS